jgi:hypothetical protein
MPYGGASFAIWSSHEKAHEHTETSGALGHTSPAAELADAAIQHTVALENLADGSDAGQREQGALCAQRVGIELRPVKPQRAGRGQTLSAGQHRQFHLRGRAIVDSSGESGMGAPVYLLDRGCTHPSESGVNRIGAPGLRV